ncbi:MAG: hypothetical protein L0387_13820 [Acidobacteria bacterium]|nr:hypothetical protein [Acidobacteriota bacterium]MCI0718917.1 hypothetical protein [Acidobacteriota bacterium]
MKTAQGKALEPGSNGKRGGGSPRRLSLMAFGWWRLEQTCLPADKRFLKGKDSCGMPDDYTGKARRIQGLDLTPLVSLG